jgi:hypothetical protein
MAGGTTPDCAQARSIQATEVAESLERRANA